MKTNFFKSSVMAMIMATSVTGLAQSRGQVTDYDKGAPAGSEWTKLFAETPNYRAYGQEVIGGRGEKFRWKMGPMWYRGRLEANKVKVFIVGQEGAQDENVSNRSFTGSTGTRMQKFLNYLGIRESYLFMNTFIYTITGQYSLFGEDRENESKLAAQQRLLWLAQNEKSAVVQHRHELFDYMLKTNGKKSRTHVELVIGVGTAGKDSVATWFRAHGSKCSASTISRSFCTGVGKLKGVYAIGVRHPGAASARNGGAGAVGGLVADFQKKADIVAKLIKEKKIKLPKDRASTRNFSTKFKYGYAPVPHKDFAFGTNFRMGKRGTTSNRRSAHTVQVFSDNGCYNNGAIVKGRCSATKKEKLKYDDPKDLRGSAPSEMESYDLPFEAPKSPEMRDQFDPGPVGFEKSMKSYISFDYSKLGVTQDKSFGYHKAYRGRLGQAKALIIADQVSHTDFFSGRALSGAAGQRLQTFIEATGLDESYGIIRSLPADTLDLSTEKVTSIALSKRVVTARNKLINAVLAKGNTEIVIAVGPVAQAIVEEFGFKGVEVFNMDIAVPSISGHVAEYNKVLKKIKASGFKGDSKGKFKYDASLSIIPRLDLPFHTRWWMGTSGDAAARAYTIQDGERVYNGNYYRVYAPKWNNRWKAVLGSGGYISEKVEQRESDSIEEFKIWAEENQ